MTNDTNEQAETSKKPKNSSGKPENVEARPQCKAGRLPVAIATLALIIAVGGIAGGYYLYSKKIEPLFELHAAMESIQQHADDKITEINQQFDGRLAKVSARLDLLQQGDALNQQRFHGVEENLDKIRGKAFWSTREWKLAEIRYLVQIAQDRIQLMHDTQTAETALVAALGRLAELADPSLEPLRERLQHDLQKVTVPTEGNPLTVIAKLEELVSSVKPFPHTDPKPEKGPESVDKTRTSQSPLDLVSTLIKNRVKIVHHDDKLNALDRNRVAGYQLELLKLRVEALRLSLLQRNPQAYQHELNGIRLWLGENEELGLTGKLQREVDQLLTLKPFDPAPSLQPTLDSLGKLLSNNLHLPAQGNAGDTP